MLESLVELLVDLFLIALTLLTGFCIVGSITAALRAVSHGSAKVNTSGLVQPEMGEYAPLVNITLGADPDWNFPERQHSGLWNESESPSSRLSTLTSSGGQ